MTLTELSYYSRKYAPYAVLAFLVFMIFFYIVKLSLIYIQGKKPQTTYINPIFSKIEALEIKEATPSSDFTFTIDTIEGQPVTATAAARVYFLPKEIPGFGYREKIYIMAKSLGFDTDSVVPKLNDSEAVFNDGKQKLTVDIANFNFKYEYNFDNNPEVFDGVVNPEAKTAETKAVNFLNSIGRYPEELSRGKTNSVYWFYNKDVRQSVVLDKGDGANMIEVDFYRPDINEYPAVSPKYYNSQNYVLMVFYEGGYKILRAQTAFFAKSNEQIGVYPLVTGNKAYEDLVAGKGMVILAPKDNKSIVIKKMFLGYYDPDFYQQYLQPVYVFLGENNFVAYVPAVSEEYLTYSTLP